MIDNYKFGRIEIDGVLYNKDVILYSWKGEMHIISHPWMRKEGHICDEEDLKDVSNYEPHKIFIGTGYDGKMKVKGDVFQNPFITAEILIHNTPKMIKEFNSFITCNSDKLTVLAIHLTC